MPGNIAKSTKMPAVTNRIAGCAKSCTRRSALKLEFSDEETRVTIMPAQIEVKRAGICVTRPSPMVSTVYICTASWIDNPEDIPINIPPSIFAKIMNNPAMASPWTNFIAPSIEPYSCDSRRRSSRFLRASSDERTPARASLSITICLPGSASSAKRAATSETRIAPFDITIKLTTVTIEKMITPTTTSPRIRNVPKASITCPASPWLRIKREEATLSPRRKRVPRSRIVGKV